MKVFSDKLDSKETNLSFIGIMLYFRVCEVAVREQVVKLETEKRSLFQQVLNRLSV